MPAIDDPTPAAPRLEAAPTPSPSRAVARTVLAVIVFAAAVPLALSVIAAVLGRELAALPFLLIFLLLPLNLGAVGAVLTARRPENRVGWLLLVAGAFTAVTFACGEYERYALAGGDPVAPFLVLAAWLATWAFIPAVGILVVFLPLLYPSGHLPSARWRPLVVVAVFGVVAGTIGPATVPGPLGGDPLGPLNPFVPPEPLLTVVQTIAAIGNALAAPVFLLALASLLVRFRRSRNVERQQIKWFLLAAAVTSVLFAVSQLPLSPLSDVAWALGLLAMCFLPLAIGLAILRYRLYDIDRLVSRVVGYTLVTAVLAASFAVAVVVSETILEPITASNTLAIAASTLVVAAVFQRVRRPIQAGVDRRFDRSHVQAEAVADSFSARLRDVTDLGTIRVSIVEGVETAWSPSSVGVWIRSA